MSKAQERRKEKDEDAFRVRVIDEQRDELMWLKWMQRDWRSVCCVNGLIMKTKNCCGCSESFVLLMHKRAKPSLHLCAPSECVREKERIPVAWGQSVLLSYPRYQWHAHWFQWCVLFDWCQWWRGLNLIYPQTESLHTLGAQHDSFLLSLNLKKIKKKKQ